MKPSIDPIEAAILNAILNHKLEIEKLEQMHVVYTSSRRTSPMSVEFAGLGIIAATTKILTTDGDLTTKEIANRLLAGGIQTRAKNFVATVHSTLRNSPKRFRFRHVNRELAWSLNSHYGQDAT